MFFQVCWCLTESDTQDLGALHKKVPNVMFLKENTAVMDTIFKLVTFIFMFSHKFNKKYKMCNI